MTGRPAVPNEEVAAAAAANDDVLIPFASVHPHPPNAAEEVRAPRPRPRRSGVQVPSQPAGVLPERPRPSTPSTRRSSGRRRARALPHPPLGIGTGLPGGGGIRLEYSNPMYVDDVAVDFPQDDYRPRVPSFPWQDEAISVALHKQQVYIDLSGWSPKYFPPQLVRYANTQLRDRVVFGSDYPMITPTAGSQTSSKRASRTRCGR